MEKKIINQGVKNFLRKTEKSLVSCEVLFKEGFYEDVKSGLIEVKYSKYFAKLLDSRFECDYDERYTAEKFLAEEAIKRVKSFKEEVYKILKCKN